MINKFPISFVFIFFSIFALAADDSTVTKKRLNLILSNRSRGFDPALVSFHTQAWFNQLFHRNKMRFIIARNFEQAVERITSVLKKEQALIGTLWFDSHGHMGRRTSLLEIGDVEVNNNTITEAWIMNPLSRIGSYCDSLSNISLGSCYSAAGFYAQGTEQFPPQRMNGDSLMAQFEKLMNHATIFGAVSWIMTHPGIYSSGFALAGHPGARRFKDPVFKPAWDSLGIWKKYNKETGIEMVNTVTLDHDANILMMKTAYLDVKKHRKRQEKLLRRLKEGNFNHRYYHKRRNPLHFENGKKLVSP